MTDFTLEDAFKLFEPGSGYVDCSRLVAENLELKLDSSFEDYVNLIYHNTYEWFESFPCKYKSKSTLEKPKSAMKFLLTREVAQKSLGNDMCNGTIEKLDECWKKHWKELVVKRSGGTAVNDKEEPTPIAEPEKDEPQKVYSDNLLKENEQLKKTIKDLKEWLMVFVENSTENAVLCRMYKALLDKY